MIEDDINDKPQDSDGGESMGDLFNKLIVTLQRQKAINNADDFVRWTDQNHEKIKALLDGDPVTQIAIVTEVRELDNGEVDVRNINIIGGSRWGFRFKPEDGMDRFGNQYSEGDIIAKRLEKNEFTSRKKIGRVPDDTMGQIKAALDSEGGV